MITEIRRLVEAVSAFECISWCIRFLQFKFTNGGTAGISGWPLPVVPSYASGIVDGYT